MNRDITIHVRCHPFLAGGGEQTTVEAEQQQVLVTIFGIDRQHRALDLLLPYLLNGGIDGATLRTEKIHEYFYGRNEGVRLVTIQLLAHLHLDSVYTGIKQVAG